MLKHRLTALLLAALLLATAVTPAYAAEDPEVEDEQVLEEIAGEPGEPQEDAEEDEDSPKDEDGKAGEEDESSEAGEEDEVGEAGEEDEENEDSQDDAGLSGDDGDAQDAPAPVPEIGTVVAGMTLAADQHTAYAYGSGGEFPSFNPAREITRAEAAVMLCRLLPEPVPLTVTFSDVPDTAWYADAVRTLGSLGVMRPGEDTCETGEAVTRAEFIRYVACFFPLRDDAELFPDVPESSPDALYIRSARAYGWTGGRADGLFYPDDPISRAEVVVILNRALGRTADKDYINSQHPAFYVDVLPSDWYYYDVIEASVSHSHTGTGASERWTTHVARTNVPTNGLHLVDGWLYYYDSNKGDVLRSAEAVGHTFDKNGRFTTGSAELDLKLRDIVLRKTNSSMTQEEMLRALYVYTRDSFTYLRRAAYKFGATGFMMEDALRILNTGYGNCYCYASLFWYLSRWIGYDSVIYSGTVGSNRAPHCWVEIAFNGVYYIFDTELEMAYRLKNRFDVNLYKYRDTTNKWRYVRP